MLSDKQNRFVLIVTVVAIAGIGMFAFAGSANAAPITVDGTANWNANANTITGTFDASGSDKLVVIVTGEHGFPNNEGGNVSSVTYDGVELIEAVDRNPIVDEPGPDPPKVVDQTYNSIFYLDNPATSTGEIVANASTRGNVTVFGLSGTSPGVGATAISPQKSSSIDLTTTGTDSLVIASLGMGGYGNTANVNNVSADPPLTQVSAQNNGGGRTWDGHVVAWADAPTAGFHTYSFTGGNISGGAHVIAAEFESAVIPEPTTFALAALGLLGLVGLTRRRKR